MPSAHRVLATALWQYVNHQYRARAFISICHASIHRVCELPLTFVYYSVPGHSIPIYSHSLHSLTFYSHTHTHTHFIRVYSPHPHRPSSLSTECWIFAQGIILYFFVYSFITYLNYGKRFYKANLLANCIFDDLVQAMILWQYLTVYSNSPLYAAKCVAVVGRTVFYYRKLCFRSWIYIFWQENQTVLKAPRTPCVFHSHTHTHTNTVCRYGVPKFGQTLDIIC